MEGLGAFAEIAPHLANPLVLVGFGLLLFFGIHRTLIKSGLLRPPSAKDSSAIVRALLRYGFVIALVIILAGFIYAGVKAYIESRERVAIATAPKVDIDAIVNSLRDQIAASTEREGAYHEQIRQLTAAVTDLAQKTEEPNAPPGVKEALEQLAEGNTRAAEKIFADTLERRAAEGEVALKEAAEAARHLGALAFLHDTQKALNAYRQAVALDPRNPDGWNQLGVLLRRVGDLDGAEDAYETVLKLGEAGQDAEWQANAYGNLGIVYLIRGELGRAEEMHKKALALDQELGRKAGMANAYTNLGNVYQTRGELGRAEEMFEKALALDEELGRKQGMASTYTNLGIVYATRGELGRAEEMHKKALALDEELGPNEGMARSYGNLGIVYATRGELGRAEEMFEKALALDKELGHKEGMASTYTHLGIVYGTRALFGAHSGEGRGELGRAEEMHKKALALNEELGSKLGMAINYGNLGNLYGTRGELGRAEEMFEKALALDEELGRKQGMASTYTSLGIVYATRGELGRAEEMFEKALELFVVVGASPQIEQVNILLDKLGKY